MRVSKNGENFHFGVNYTFNVHPDTPDNRVALPTYTKTRA